jgi:hypothetical protein
MGTTHNASGSVHQLTDAPATPSAPRCFTGGASAVCAGVQFPVSEWTTADGNAGSIFPAAVEGRREVQGEGELEAQELLRRGTTRRGLPAPQSGKA